MIQSTLTNFVVGDDLIITNNPTIPSGYIIDTAWFMTKRSYTDTDTLAIISKTITTVSGVDGIINRADYLQPQLTFILTHIETALLTPLSEYVYSIKLKFTNSYVTTCEIGVISAYPAVKQGIT